jgi:hypothetical protein
MRGEELFDSAVAEVLATASSATIEHLASDGVGLETHVTGGAPHVV